MDHVDHLAGAGAADGVAERDPAAPLVGAVAVEIRQIVEGATEDRGKRLVELEEVDIGKPDPGALQQRRDDLEGALAHVLAVDADVVPRSQHRDGFETELGGAFFAREQQRRRAVVEARRIERGDGAAVALEVGPGAGQLVHGDVP